MTMKPGYPTVKHAPSKKIATCRTATRAQKTLLPLFAVGGSLAGMPASAIELGDMTVQSRLGQPLRASIAYVLGPQEMISNSCVSIGSGNSDNGFPGIGQATLSVADGVIRLTGKTPVREPMVATRIVVNCPSMVRLNREYTLFIDPVGRADDEAEPIRNTAAVERPAVAPARPAASSAATGQATTAAPVRRPAASTTPRRPANSVPQARIGKSSQYEVQAGDSLSQIAERIENRPIGLWAAVDVIFQANPDAFINNDPNKLMAGSLLTIPSFDGSMPVVAAGLGVAVQDGSQAYSADDIVVSQENAAAIVVPQGNTAAEIAPEDIGVVSTVAAFEEIEEPVVEDVLADATNDLAPADVTAEADNPFLDRVPADKENVVIPDTELDGPVTSSSSPNVPTAVITTSSEVSSPSWLLWLAGTGLAIIIGLLLFGRLFRGRRGDAQVIAPRYEDDARPIELARGASDELDPANAFGVEDDAPTEENLALDADLTIGSGLRAATEMDAAQDFGFASPTTVDFELPPHSSTIAEDETILTSEILPEDEEYDLSVIIDATKMPRPEDITRRDLKAIEVNPDDTATSGSYTINKEVDFDILAQDYEDEFTATQAVNTEISRAAAELISDLGKDTTDAWMTTEETVLMTEEEETAMMAPQGTDEDTIGAAGDMTDITAEMPLAHPETAPLELEEDPSINETGTIERLLAADYTLEMAAAENDEDTREMELERDDTVDTKAL